MLLRGDARQRLERAIPFQYLAILPALIATVLVMLGPLLYSFGLSFYRYVLTDPRNIYFIGLANYAQALADPTFISWLRHCEFTSSVSEYTCQQRDTCVPTVTVWPPLFVV